MRKETLLVALTWFLVVASITICANATAGARLLASEQVDYPQGKLNLSCFMGHLTLFVLNLLHCCEPCKFMKF